jgi:hypothetical protein
VGMYHRMGDTLVQYYGLSREALVALQLILEREWELAALDADTIMEVAQLISFVLLGYARALRGEDI